MTEAAIGAPLARTPPKRVRRAPSETARWHMSKDAIDGGFWRFISWSEDRCMRELARLRWGSDKSMPCPMCGTIDTHEWDRRRDNWRCNACHKYFSVTTGTVFEGRKRSHRSMLMESFLWICGAAGAPALMTRRALGTATYNTSFVHVQKLREGLVRGYNTGFVSGVVEMDGAHASGRRANEKRGRPLGGFKKTPEQEEQQAQDVVAAFNAKQDKKRKKPIPAPDAVRDPTYGQAYPESRRIVITMRRRSGNPGKGAMLTRVGVGLAETPDVVEALVERHVLVPESILATDSGSAFSKIGKKFQLHLTVNHNDTLVGPKGEHVNNAEGFTARQDRAEAGTYLNIEPKYLHDYACETAFREDHRRLPPGQQMARTLFWALNVGESEYWRGFTRGNHRAYEHLVPERREAEASGPKKRVPGEERYVRRPR